MNDEDRKYLRLAEKMRPGIEIFEKMVQILKSEHKEINILLATLNNTLLETHKTLRI
jgi:hypothetical protein